MTMQRSSASAHSVHSLTLARMLIALVTLTVIILDVTSIPTAYQLLRTPCSPCDPNSIQFTTAQVRTLIADGYNLNIIALYSVALIVITESVYIGVGVLLFLHRSDDRMALLTSLTLTTFGGAAFTGTMHAFSSANAALWLVTGILNVIGQSSFIAFLFLFPTGRFVPRWTIIPTIIWSLSWALQMIQNPAVHGVVTVVQDGPVFLLLILSMVIAQVYRYARVSSPAQRRQTKWVVFGLGIGLTGFAVSLIAGSFLLPQNVLNNPVASLLDYTLTFAFFLIIPLAIAVAILRSRLYDIDILIKRTLVYGSLTAILAALYFALVIGAQRLTHQFTGLGQQQPVVIVLSTLLIAALAQPLRRRLQRTIDRRFYRSRYDAAKTIAAFSASLRSEVNLTQLNEHLLGVVEETMRPTHASLWLRPTAREANRGE